MTWSVQRQPRPRGSYYSAIYKLPAGGKPRCVTVGFIDGDPPTAVLTARLRAGDPDGTLPDEVVVDVCNAADDIAAAARVATHRTMERVATIRVSHDDSTRVEKARPFTEANLARLEAMGVRLDTVAAPAPAAPFHPKGTMTLQNYYDTTWKPLRSKQPGTWAREEGRWETLILPALGDQRLCDLDAEKWTTSLAKMAGGGNHRRLTQTAYRTSLRHAETLGWIKEVHKFAPIKGSTKRVFAAPEPLTIDEVETFLSAASAPVFRAMFGLQIGQGLRPSELILVHWEDVDLDRKCLFVRGTKNDLAKATVPLTPLSEAEMRRWWVASGKPTSGPAFTGQKTGKGKPFTAYPKSAFQTAARNSGLNASRTRKLFPYGSRHAFATIAATSGIDRAFTKDMMRHSRASTVLDEAYIRVSKA